MREFPYSSPRRRRHPQESAGGRHPRRTGLSRPATHLGDQYNWAPATPTSGVERRPRGDRSPDATPLPPQSLAAPWAEEAIPLGRYHLWGLTSAWKSSCRERQRQSDQREEERKSGGVRASLQPGGAQDIPSWPLPTSASSHLDARTQENLIFPRRAACPPARFPVAQGCREVSIRFPAVSRPLNLRHPIPGVVFLLHGNGGSLDSWFSNHDLTARRIWTSSSTTGATAEQRQRVSGRSPALADVRAAWTA